MTSRGLLWLAFGAAALPLLFEATVGCSYTPPTGSSDGPVDDNAYTCACSCETGPRQASVAIATSSDDAEQTGSTMQLDGQDLDLGLRTVGIRFSGLALPQGAMIGSAIVQFTADATNGATSNLQIFAQLATDAATFSSTPNDLSGRPVGMSVAWPVDPWTNGAAGPAQRTPDLAGLIQELVDQPGWSNASAVVLRIQGPSGQRVAVAFEENPAQAAVLQLTYQSSVAANLPVCATPAIIAQNVDGKILQAEAEADCAGRVQTTLGGIANACGYPTPCSCALVIPPVGDASFDASVCDTPCTPIAVDGQCEHFDPNAFWECIEGGGTPASCATHVLATHAGMDEPVCVATGSPFAYQLYGLRSTCEVEGTSQIEVGDREPQHDPATTGEVEIHGTPCPGSDCPIGTFFQLAIEPITFSVRFASDPTFSDLSGLGRSRSEALLASGEASFAEDAIEGTGNGRRGSNGLAIDALNQQPLALGVDWLGKTCSLVGNLASTVDGENPDGLCMGDGTTFCTVDSPDCDTAGGPCVFEAEDIEPLTVNVDLAGMLVNQPPSAAAGADQMPECTSTAGASFTLDGRGSSDPDQDIAVVSWRAGSRTAPELAQSLVVGQSLGVGAAQSYLLRVIDRFAQADEDATTVMVKDTTPPVLSAQWLPQPPLGAYPRFRLVFSATDTCDAAPQLKGVVQTPDLTGWKFIKRKSTVSPLKLDYDLLRRTLEIRAANPDAILAQLLANGGLLVSSGQRISLVPENAYEQEFELEFERNGNLKLEAPDPTLAVMAKDISGNMATTEVEP